MKMKMKMNESKASNVLSGKNARPCDSCLMKRARWFCAADDAFLCQSCDAAVHSANLLASRHQRVRLETSNSKPGPLSAPSAWHTKKARTPRHPKRQPPPLLQVPLVPEMGSDDPFPENDVEEQLLFCRVPVFDPFEEGMGSMVLDDDNGGGDLNLEELAEFAADVESLLGPGGVDHDDYYSLFDDDHHQHEKKSPSVKVEEDNDEDEDDDGVMPVPLIMRWDHETEMKMENEEESKKRMLLRLNYEAVMAAWEGSSPWVDGMRPQLDNIDTMIDELLQMACSSSDVNMNVNGKGGRMLMDVEREARVSRYREKRRTRLFSKKIRYEVRKLNAEKRPRMKGRFVKRHPPFLPTTNNYHR